MKKMKLSVRALLAGGDSATGGDCCSALQRHGCQVESVRDIRSAMAALCPTIQVILCSVELPDGTWSDLVEAVSTMPRPPCIVVFSKRPDASLWAEVLNRGGFDLLQTPFREEEVLWVVSAAARSRARAQDPPSSGMVLMQGARGGVG